MTKKLTEEMTLTLHRLASAKRPREVWCGNGTPGTFKALVRRGLAASVGTDTYTVTAEGKALSEQLRKED